MSVPCFGAATSLLFGPQLAGILHMLELLDLWHLKHAEQAEHLRKHQGRVVLREDNVQDDTGVYAAFTEQGASASLVTAAEVLDTLSRLPGMSGEAILSG